MIPLFLREDTFIRLISSSELLIMEGEMDVYNMIKTVGVFIDVSFPIVYHLIV